MMATMYRHEFILTRDELSLKMRNDFDKKYEDHYGNTDDKSKRELRLEVDLPEPNPIKARQILVDMLKRDV